MSSTMDVSATQAVVAQRAHSAYPRGFGFRRWLRPSVWVPTAIVFAAVALLWELVALTNPYILPSLGAVVVTLLEDPAMYWQNFFITLQEVAVGAGAAIVLGYGIAVVMSEFEIVERALMPLIVLVMVTPVIAIAPALVVAFGFGMLPKYIITGIVVFFPVLVNSLAGLRSVDPRARDVFRTLHASRWEIFRDLRFPGSMPYFFAGLRISLPLAVVGAAVAEFVAAGTAAGLGSLVTTSAAQANLEVTWASIFMLCLMGVLLISVLAIVRKRVLWWSDGEPTAQ
ncbi:Hydroxymethylpyrimidine ABC transporter, transmembrane component [Microbacterium esteraromaticum]|uniref:Hydroxymethylpyrimidine ABC transporter, transmembrane component n=1 Tax=Microbacterium esteraromaticum TaxID=57043 RepID=A0A1R4IP41_9MICO|nr:ABC transporter permease [Microbacterium esteraromaticum]SJN21405.1 Hydroxymethylpyrimidine ABC transporter, transmembrane component [Microbacterium esteraromaticum]